MPWNSSEGAPSLEFQGMCDASAAILLDDRTVVVADDESNVLRAYATTGGPPLAVSKSLSEAAGATPKGRGFRELDLEGAAAHDGFVYWIGSHGNNRKGKARPGRARLLKTRVALEGGELQVEVLEVHSNLTAALAALGIVSPPGTPPKAPGGLNIEGLAAGPDGRLHIGFRNPLANGSALVMSGPPARPDSAGRLDLGGLGIRSLLWSETRNAHVVVAGPMAGGGPFRLYEWSDAVVLLGTTLPDDLNPEAAVEFQDGSLLLLSDDGTRPVGGVPCKEAHESRRSFRGLRVPGTPPRPNEGTPRSAP